MGCGNSNLAANGNKPADSTAHGAPATEIDAETVTALRKYAIEVVPFFKNITDESSLVVTQIKGGTTNRLYKIENASADVNKNSDVPSNCVIRVYGKDTDRLISRKEELFWQGQFLETYGSNGKMLAYEFLAGYRPLVAAEFFPRRIQIAKLASAFHSKATQAHIFHKQQNGGDDKNKAETNQTYVMLKNWIELVSDIDNVRAHVAPEKRDLFDKMNLGNGGLIKERDFLLSVIEKNIDKLPVAVCHNDLTCGNFLINDADGKKEGVAEDLRLIDFEYTRNNFIYFDLGNHFCEYGGLECDFSKFPSREVICEFTRAYLEEGRRNSTITGYVADNKHNTKSHHDQQEQQHKALIAVTDAEVEEAADFAQFFALISHFGWALWGLVQEQVSEIDFGFMDYAWSRWEAYMQNKEAFTKKLI